MIVDKTGASFSGIVSCKAAIGEDIDNENAGAPPRNAKSAE